MDCYFGSGIDDFVVPRDREPCDRLPSPDSWSRWGISASKSFGSLNKCFFIDANMTREELNFNGKSSCNETEMETSDHDKDHSSSSSVCERFSEESFTLSGDRPDNRLDDLAGFEEMNDIFLSSLLEDLPKTEHLDESFYFSPECGMMPVNNLRSQSISSDMNDSMGNSKYLKTHDFSPSKGWDNGDVTAVQFIPCNSEQIGCSPVKALFGEDTVPSEQNSMNGLLGQDASLEESVLQELVMVMAQLTDKTRICFRDALFRLAKNTKQHHMVTPSEDGYLAMEKPIVWMDHDQTMRSGSKKAMESETNTIDRAVAHLMFSKMDFSVQEPSIAPSVNLNQGVFGETGLPVKSEHEVIAATGQPIYSLNQPKIHRFTHLQGDAEVPIHAQRGPQETYLNKNSSRNDAENMKSLVLEFG